MTEVRLSDGFVLLRISMFQNNFIILPDFRILFHSNVSHSEIDIYDMSVVQSIGAGEVEIDFTGVFPRFNTGTNSYSVTLVGGGASKTLNQSITYNASYL